MTRWISLQKCPHMDIRNNLVWCVCMFPYVVSSTNANQQLSWTMANIVHIFTSPCQKAKVDTHLFRTYVAGECAQKFDEHANVLRVSTVDLASIMYACSTCTAGLAIVFYMSLDKCFGNFTHCKSIAFVCLESNTVANLLYYCVQINDVFAFIV